jgi:hypothetical protein
LINPTHAAETIQETLGLVDYIMGSKEHQPLKGLGLYWGGWLQTGITANSNAPQDGYNGPVTFGDRSGQLQLNQFYLYLQKSMEIQGDHWDFGGRFDAVYGEDAIFTQAYGVPYVNSGNPNQPLQRNNWDLNLGSHQNPYNAFALPQAYLSINVPIGNGLEIKAGHFYTPIGYEVVTAPDNFFYTKPYTFQYGEPFTHTGILTNYSFNDNWAALVGVVTGSATGGWDGGFNQQLGNWDFLGMGTWNSDEETYSLSVSGTAGERSSSNPGNSSFWGLYSAIGKANWLDNSLHYVIQHDHGFANGVWSQSLGQAVNAQWYGINQYLMYDLLEDLGIGIRAEWWRDANGFRLSGPARCAASENVSNPNTTPPQSQAFAGSCGAFTQGNYRNNTGAGSWNNAGMGANYYELTAGINYKPLKWIIMRPNVRYDFSQGASMYLNAQGQALDYQFTFSFDTTVLF